jgi:hypothetical protein
MSKDSDRERAAAYSTRVRNGRPALPYGQSWNDVLAAEFAAIRSETIKECAAACLVQIKRESGYHGQWEGYGPWMGDMTGTECSAVILALDKQ